MRQFTNVDSFWIMFFILNNWENPILLDNVLRKDRNKNILRANLLLFYYRAHYFLTIFWNFIIINKFLLLIGHSSCYFLVSYTIALYAYLPKGLMFNSYRFYWFLTMLRNFNYNRSHAQKHLLTTFHNNLIISFFTSMSSFFISRDDKR